MRSQLSFIGRVVCSLYVLLLFGHSVSFAAEKYDLKGWRLVDVNNNITILEINNYVKNLEIKKNFFLIPEENQ